MDRQKAKLEIEELAQTIEEHNYRYYVLDQPTVSDKEYDDLLKRLIELEVAFPEFISPNSPTQRIGAKMEVAAKPVRHAVKMYSLDNTYSIGELKAWEQRVLKGLGNQKVRFTVELKIDGVSASLTYMKGNLTLGATRGDGVTGEDVTHNVKTLRSVPLKLRPIPKAKIPEIFEVRGEVYMTRKDFEKTNAARKERGEVLFANPRNSASGALKLLDSRETAARKLHFFAHSYGRVEGGKAFDTHWEFLEECKEYGFRVNPWTKPCANLDEVVAFCLDAQKRREEIPYDVDGVVVKVDSLVQQRQLGFTIKSPRWAVAYKFPAYQATTAVRAITVQVGRTGTLTPVAELEPVLCGGVTISRATLHNFEEVERLCVNVGDRVLLERAGDVIPKIVKVVTHAPGKAKPFVVPKACPECGGKIAKVNTEDVAYKCLNPSCPRQIERGLLHFASREAMDVEGLGESVVGQILAAGFVQSLADIYSLTKEQLLTLELFGDKRAENLLLSIQNSKQRPLSKLLYGLGIVNIGSKAAYLLAQRFGTMDALMKASAEDLQAVYEVGPVMAESVVRFFEQAATRELIAKFKKAGVNLSEPKTAVVSQKLAGKKFVFTGELERWTREEAAAKVKTLGADVISSVSKKTDYVVAGENAGSKYDKAVQLGVTILTEQEFEEMVHEEK